MTRHHQYSHPDLEAAQHVGGVLRGNLDAEFFIVIGACGRDHHAVVVILDGSQRQCHISLNIINTVWFNLPQECLLFAQKHLFREPRTRRDVVDRKARNAASDVSVVKSTWNQFCTPAARILPIDEVLKDVNKAITEAYLLANVHVVRMCALGLPVPPLDQ